MRNIGIRPKIVIAASVVTALAVAAVAFAVSSVAASRMEEDARRYGNELAARHAADVARQFEGAVTTAKDLTVALVALRRTDIQSRAPYGALLEEILKQNEELFGVWSGWEPNALDGQDAYYRDRAGHDATGRYIPYYSRAGGSVRLDPLVGYDEPGAGDYYLLPKERGELKVIDPYLYPVDGVDYLMTTVGVPIEIDGATVGVAGVDLLLDSVSQDIEAIRPLGEGHAVLLSTSGQVVAGLGAEAVGRPLADGAAASLVQQAVDTGEVATVDGDDVVSGADSFLFAKPIELGPSDTWVLLVGVPKSQALAALDTMRTSALVVALVAMALAAVVLLGVAAGVVRPISRMTAAMRSLAGGDLSVELPPAGPTELGRMAEALAVFKQTAIERESLTQQREALQRKAEEERRAAFGNLADSFEHAVNGVVSNVAASAQQVEQSALSMTETTDGLKGSVSGIGAQVQRSSDVARRAVEEAETTSGVVRGLTDAASRIGEAVVLIRSIAEQTNLLALNATIEAARAGDAGRGFAVVANEVKELAAQTERATADVTARIGAIQSTSAEAAAALERIGSTIGEIDEITRTVSASLSGGGGVEHAVLQSRHEAEALLSAAAELAAQASNLRDEVDGFTSSVRAS